ncbi:MAG: hypothetical protein DRH08_01780 [Deltaproteobacteria bacterium]|nr:MAG: hypothetical protein DRH08_01780 [Deltaproteobacteria bacterium]
MSATVQNQGLDLDRKVLEEFIFTLNIARRQVMAYPPGHPMVATATGNLIEVIPRLLVSHDEITLGIARDTLMIEGGSLGRSNPVFRDLAQNLFNLQIASLTITRDLTEDETCRFFSIFRQTPEQLAEEGGIDHILARSDFKGIKAQGIDFSNFSTIEVDVVHAPKTKVLESDTALLWKSFANGIIKGSIDHSGQAHIPTGGLDPTLLAEIMNQEHSVVDSSLETNYEEAVTDFLHGTDRKKLRGREYQELLGRLGDMVGALNPELSRRFMNSMLRTCVQRPDAAELILNKMPQTALLDAMEQIDSSTIEIPQTLIDVLGKLASYRVDEESQSRVAGETSHSERETIEQLTKLFSEDHSEYFVPKDYRAALAVLAATKINHALDERQAEELISSLEGHKVEEQFNEVLLDLLGRGVDHQTSDAIGRNMDELVDYFLETGDFKSLASIYGHLHRHVTVLSKETFDSTRKTLERFAGKEFSDTVLDGLDTWGKPEHASIQALIERVGIPFVGPLLERLADEQSMSRRRLFMDCLIQIGPPVKTPISARLKDDRWFFVRNMVIILREIKDPSIIPLLGRLSGNTHPKVQFEVMNTYLYYGDDRADRYLLKELAGKNPASLLSAIRLAANSRNPKIVIMLSKLLNVRLPAEHELEVKTNAIKVLRKSATEDVLPELASFFLKKKLFGGSQPLSLQIKAIAILEKIGTVDAGILAGKVSQSASGELAHASENVLAQIHRKMT